MYVQIYFGYDNIEPDLGLWGQHVSNLHLLKFIPIELLVTSHVRVKLEDPQLFMITQD